MSQLPQVPTFIDTFDSNSTVSQDSGKKEKDCTAPLTFIGPGLPPIPGRLVEKIQSGQFVELSELLPHHIGSLSGNPVLDNEDKASSKARPQVTTILEWVRCFSLYMAVIALKNPGKLPDLLGYQVLIVEARMEHEGDRWLGYDCRFRQMAAAVPTTTWAKIEPTLWNMAFAGKARSVRCTVQLIYNLKHAW